MHDFSCTSVSAFNLRISQAVSRRLAPPPTPPEHVKFTQRKQKINSAKKENLHLQKPGGELKSKLFGASLREVFVVRHVFSGWHLLSNRRLSCSVIFYFQTIYQASVFFGGFFFFLVMKNINITDSLQDSRLKVSPEVSTCLD